MAQSIVYRRDIPLSDLISLNKQGVSVLCPYCGTPLTFVLTPKEAAPHDVHPGIYCFQEDNHVAIGIDFAPAPGFWEQFKNDV